MIIFGHYLSLVHKSAWEEQVSASNIKRQLQPTITIRMYTYMHRLPPACLRLLPYVCLSWDFSAFQPSSPEWSGFMVERADINCVYIAPSLGCNVGGGGMCDSRIILVRRNRVLPLDKMRFTHCESK